MWLWSWCLCGQCQTLNEYSWCIRQWHYNAIHWNFYFLWRLYSHSVCCRRSWPNGRGPSSEKLSSTAVLWRFCKTHISASHWLVEFVWGELIACVGYSRNLFSKIMSRDSIALFHILCVKCGRGCICTMNMSCATKEDEEILIRVIKRASITRLY